MASIETPRELMSALIEGRKPARRSANVYVGTTTVAGVERPAIFSYGPHFCMAYKSHGRDAWCVNLDSYSRTTSTHQRGVSAALCEHGSKPNGGGESWELWEKGGAS